jgi:hypothetical protein
MTTGSCRRGSKFPFSLAVNICLPADRVRAILIGAIAVAHAPRERGSVFLFIVECFLEAGRIPITTLNNQYGNNQQSRVFCF